MNCCEKVYNELQYSTLTDNKRQFNRLPLFKLKTNFDNFLALPNRNFWEALPRLIFPVLQQKNRNGKRWGK
jgi:hypothetical protein